MTTLHSMYTDELSSDSCSSSDEGQMNVGLTDKLGKGGKVKQAAAKESNENDERGSPSKLEETSKTAFKPAAPTKSVTIKDMHKSDLKTLGRYMSACEKLLAKLCAIPSDEAFLIDVSDAHSYDVCAL